MLAGVALAAALAAAPQRAAGAARSAPVLALLALALLGALSALWTVGASDDAVRWALVIAAFAAIAVAAACLGSPVPAAAILLAVATVAAALGLVGAARHADPAGLDVCGAWRPAGPFEYPPALALVCAMALPAGLAAASSAARRLAPLGAGAGWLLVATIGVSGSRIGVALAALSLFAAAMLCGSTAAPVTALLVAVAGAASALVVGGELGDDAALQVVLAFVPGLLAAGAVAVRRPPGGRGGRSRAAALALLAVVGIAGTAAATAQERVGGCAYAGFGHGRSDIWRAAWDTVERQPLRGSGMESFATASLAAQQRIRDAPPVQYAHQLPLEAWAELGLAGLALVLLVYFAVTRAALRATREAACLLAPPALAFLAANLLDWPWHLAGCGVLWAIAVGGLVGSRRNP